MKPFFAFLFIAALHANCLSQSNSIEQVANTFLNSLDEKQRAKTIYSFIHNERYNWHYFPKSGRKGISLNELNEEQKKKALAMLKSCMSETGYAKTTGVLQLESILHELENRNDDYRNSGKYYFIVFGKPEPKGIWGWRFEGHHLSLSFSTMNNKLVSCTPGFLGANPAIVPSGPHKGKQVLREETELAFQLLHSLTPQQLQASVSTSGLPGDIITFVSRKAEINRKEGLDYASMNPNQQALFMNLIHIYVHRYTKLFATTMLNELEAAGLNNLRFTWAGTKQPDGNGYYYRIQGPTIIIEYDNSQNNANHIHTVVRDLKHDFGGDELLEHYRREHSK
jgi:hypothetical protein